MPIYRDKARGCWVFEFSRRLEGQRVRTRKSLPTSWSRAQADAYDRQESARLYAIASGTEQQRWTIDQAVASYLIERAVELKHGHGVATELALLADYYEGKPLEQLPEVCAKYLADHRDKLAPATIKNRLRYLTAAARWGWRKKGMGTSDPAARVVMPAVSNERQVYIDRRQMLQWARACPHRASRAAIRIAFYSGMRVSEILRAEVDGEHFVLPDTKNGEPALIPIHRKIRACVRQDWPSYETIRHHTNRAKVLVGLAHVHFHDTRHSAASELIDQDVDLYTVSTVLRHKSLASSARYAHLRTRKVAEAIAKIGRKQA